MSYVLLDLPTINKFASVDATSCVGVLAMPELQVNLVSRLTWKEGTRKR
jgi:hypothetical protein